ncbi:hypothetical protein [Sphaerisporangium corydalis]|uniref:Uncharacterized protein n=1 Tax=Sphaerisporangium corydalis TaxID=1441875 RepID=A0ABV9E7H9_9ACTN|nr:hypothetical protein [Sphaerisporangium corydalis]
MSLTNDVLPSPAEPRKVAFGTVEATVDYTELRKVTPDKQPAYFDAIYRLLTKDQAAEVWSQVSTFKDDDRTWLAHALYLYAKNQAALPVAHDHQNSVARLVDRASTHTAMPGAQGDAFEREVLRVCGWVSAVVVAANLPLPLEMVTKLGLVYNPPGVDIDESGRPKVGPLKAAVLRDELIPTLRKVIDGQAAFWVPVKGTHLEPEPIDRIRKLADFVQNYVALRVRPYADAWEDGPYFDGFRYSDRLQSTWVLPAGPDKQFGYLLNRAQRVGWDRAHGELLTKANYDGSRPGDQEALGGLIKEALRADEVLAKEVFILIKHTGAHTGGVGNISIQPVFPTDQWNGGKADWRWRMIRTLVHELLHRLAHPAFTAKAEGIRHGQIIREGFVDLLTVDIYAKLWDEVQRSPSAASILLGGIDATTPPNRSFFEVGYGKAGESAATIRGLLSDDHVRAAFFLGATHLIGL